MKRLFFFTLFFVLTHNAFAATPESESESDADTCYDYPFKEMLDQLLNTPAPPVPDLPEKSVDQRNFESLMKSFIKFSQRKKQPIENKLHKLLEKNVDASVTVDGFNLIHLALIKQKPFFKLARRAIDKGADPEQAIVCSKKRHVKIRGSKIFLHAQTPLHLAVALMDLKFASYLIKDKHVDPSPLNEREKTPFSYIEKTCSSKEYLDEAYPCNQLYRLFGKKRPPAHLRVMSEF